jgi:hypothetical protein
MTTALKIDQNLTWTTLEDRLATETNPTCRRILQLVIDHVKAEARRDLDAIFDTLIEHPVYKSLNRPQDPRFNPPATREGILDYYQAVIFEAFGDRLQVRWDRIIVDEHSCLTEGECLQAFPGSALAPFGVEGADGDALYLGKFRACVIWGYDHAEERLVGEYVYESGNPFDGILDRRIEVEDIVAPNL